MPMTYTEITTDSGMRYLRVDTSGHVSFEDAKEFEAWVTKPEWNKGLALSVVAQGTEYAPEARKHFTLLNDHLTSLATVVTSPIVRAAINMMLRITRTRGRSPLKMFTDEAEAIAWLESTRDSVPDGPSKS